MNSGSVDSLKVSTRWGLSPNARQIRPIVDFDSPVSAAIAERDQCVASRGVRSSVSTTTCSTRSSLTDRGPPGRSSSARPANPFSTNRRRHLPTVADVTPKPAATVTLSAPSAQLKMIFDRNASAWADVDRRAHRWSCSRSSIDTINEAFGRPVRAIPQSTTYQTNSGAPH